MIIVRKDVIAMMIMKKIESVESTTELIEVNAPAVRNMKILAATIQMLHLALINLIFCNNLFNLLYL
jgi:hypothetical protein